MNINARWPTGRAQPRLASQMANMFVGGAIGAALVLLLWFVIFPWFDR
jgi:hypothetical protein